MAGIQHIADEHFTFRYLDDVNIQGQCAAVFTCNETMVSWGAWDGGPCFQFLTKIKQ
jgi:hypothetical protein